MMKPLALGVMQVSGLVSGLVSGASACTPHWTAEVNQPVLVLDAGDAPRTSWPATIELRDMELGRTRLANTAYYVALSRDRFRFHLTLRHKWESMSDLRTWEAWVEDGHGKRYPLEGIDQRSTEARYGIFVRAPIYTGVVDFTIYARDLIGSTDRLTLVLRRPDREYRYVWHSLAADPDS